MGYFTDPYKRGMTCGEPTHFLTIDPNFQRDIQAGVTLRVFVTMDLAGLESYQSFSDTLGARLADIKMVMGAMVKLFKNMYKYSLHIFRYV